MNCTFALLSVLRARFSTWATHIADPVFLGFLLKTRLFPFRLGPPDLSQQPGVLGPRTKPFPTDDPVILSIKHDSPQLSGTVYRYSPDGMEAGPPERPGGFPPLGEIIGRGHALARPGSPATQGRGGQRAWLRAGEGWRMEWDLNPRDAFNARPISSRVP